MLQKVKNTIYWLKSKFIFSNSLRVFITLSFIFLVWQGHSALGAESTDSYPLPNGQETNLLFFPIVANQPPVSAYRIGYTNSRNSISSYPNSAGLRAGWYTNWSVAKQPIRPAGIEYVQMVRVHQKLSCGDWFNRNRETCPYAQPLDYVFKPDAATIKAAAQKNPGSVWLIGNEMDRVDWYVGCAEWDGSVCVKEMSDGQDEMLPETYARAFHDIYDIIKVADPSSQVAIGGLIQPTPLRLQWLSLAWDAYTDQYSKTMPVDIWNIHNFILQEDKNAYGASVPPGLPGSPTQGEYIGQDSTHIDHAIFDQQIRAMRQWMKDRGQQQKPLIVTEYGVLYSHRVSQDNRTIDFGDSTLVHDFMLWSFDYFLETKDCGLGFQKDDCRLVQRWLWFSLDHAYTDGSGTLQGYFNPHTSLFDATTKNIFPAGEKFRNYVQEKFDKLSHRWVN